MKRRTRNVTQSLAFFLLTICCLLIVVPVIAIIVYVATQGGGAISWQFLSEFPKNQAREGGIFPALLGSFYLMIGVVLFALPIGLLAAIYLHEYAKQNPLTRLINLSIVNLAGVPSIVFGLFGLSFFV